MVQPTDAFLTIRWTYQDLLVALARRLPAFEHADLFDLLDAEIDHNAVGVVEEQLEALASLIERPLSDASVLHGWGVIEDALLLRLGAPSVRLRRGEHPNAPIPPSRG